MILILPLILLIAYFGGMLFVLRLPDIFAERYDPAELGYGAAVLDLTFLCNLVLALYCIIAALIVVVLAFTWCRAALFHYKGAGGQYVAYILLFTVLMLAFSGGTSYYMVTTENLFDIVASARTDKLMLEGNANEDYAGVAYIRSRAPLAGAGYGSKPDVFYDLRVLENGTTWVTLYLPIGLAEERGVDRLPSSEPYDEVTVEYLPNTRVVSEIWLAGQEPEPEPEEDDD